MRARAIQPARKHRPIAHRVAATAAAAATAVAAVDVVVAVEVVVVAIDAAVVPGADVE